MYISLIAINFVKYNVLTKLIRNELNISIDTLNGKRSIRNPQKRRPIALKIFDTEPTVAKNLSSFIKTCPNVCKILNFLLLTKKSEHKTDKIYSNSNKFNLKKLKILIYKNI